MENGNSLILCERTAEPKAGSIKKNAKKTG
jgi:hypothetical protein